MCLFCGVTFFYLPEKEGKLTNALMKKGYHKVAREQPARPVKDHAIVHPLTLAVGDIRLDPTVSEFGDTERNNKISILHG